MLGVDRALLLGCTELGNRLCYRSHTDLSNFHALVVIDLQSLVDDAGWPFNRNRFVRGLGATKLGLLILSVLDALFLDFCIHVVEAKKVLVVTGGLFTVGLVLVQLNWGEKLLLSQQTVDLFDEFESGVLLVEDQGVN